MALSGLSTSACRAKGQVLPTNSTNHVRVATVGLVTWERWRLDSDIRPRHSGARAWKITLRRVRRHAHIAVAIVLFIDRSLTISGATHQANVRQVETLDHLELARLIYQFICKAFHGTAIAVLARDATVNHLHFAES